LVLLVSILVFIIIQLPPGDFFDQYRLTMEAEGMRVDPATLDQLRVDYGLDQPIVVQYFMWIGGIVLRGDFGYSFEYNQPVSALIGERLFLTILINLFVLGVVWLVAIPIGVYSATHKYSILDYVFNFIAFIGTGVPGFVLALVVMWLAYYYLGADVGGLFSREFVAAPWSLERVIDLFKHMWVVVFVLAVGGTSYLIRTMRANMADELAKPYVATARAKGLREREVVRKYPLRVALNPFISGLGRDFRELLSGSQVTAVVLNLPITGPMLLQSLLAQDMYLAGGFILILSLAGIVGTLISDILLAIADPRIRYD
ncbi:partial Nickel transport system permease protein NikB, partial [Anaerolineae bacterium]